MKFRKFCVALIASLFCVVTLAACGSVVEKPDKMISKLKSNDYFVLEMSEALIDEEVPIVNRAIDARNEEIREHNAQYPESPLDEEAYITTDQLGALRIVVAYKGDIDAGTYDFLYIGYAKDLKADNSAAYRAFSMMLDCDKSGFPLGLYEGKDVNGNDIISGKDWGGTGCDAYSAIYTFDTWLLLGERDPRG